MNAPLAMSIANAEASAKSSRASSFKIAIVGCGPRGLYCLQSLSEQLRQLPRSPRVVIDIFEPTEFPGAGNVYAPCQPHYLKMNFAAKHINAWAGVSEDDAERCNLVRWFNREHPVPLDPNDFIPRAVVGAYLRECFQSVHAELRTLADVTLHRCKVTQIQGRDTCWRLHTDRFNGEYDELVLTVGHEGWRSSEPMSKPTPLKFPPAFPIRENLGRHAVPPRTTVAIRGFGLTWIDATLALTMGRGGIFDESGENWRYLPSGEEPRRIVPFSRSGRPMLAKPNESLFPQPVALDAIWSRGCESIDALPSPIAGCDLRSALWRIIARAAASAVNHFGGRGFVTPAEVQSWFAVWCRGAMQPEASLAAMRQSYRVATGRAAPDVPWALGAAWRNLYPALVRRISYGGLAAEQWPTFRRVATEMERIAFGPPADNVGRMLALVDAGVVDLRFLTAEPRPSDSSQSSVCTLANDRENVTIDHCIDAVLPSPYQLHRSGPLHGLLDADIIQRLHGSEGILVDRLGRPIDGKGRPTLGLAIIGRATEGCVLGNDTLSRSLHDQPQRWAADVATRIQVLQENR
ncbi:hypothetical protein Poly24_23630 [Rosistilla carotiformis]|uniref:FAD-dependent urate hydroxylase HpyO/Asp monooxygenase CreE-like FAD/NAD(P)-binding domain-containing protein n=1 Tax=Rosistilla carotiformis TaxID=2528017 RepID=A0A518JSX9_9BACT|nr:FAD/NAD(P)-binding domain-containing protein [Rosistilla carotiformis]QDV68651.1 hypothetical protein Poly24_23630 [Rosistilla carotiformis]